MLDATGFAGALKRRLGALAANSRLIAIRSAVSLEKL
jgi:hypothetical protein